MSETSARYRLVAALPLLAACDREVAVGHEDSVVAGGGVSAVLWRADHDRGSLDEWLGDGDGWEYTQGTGTLEPTTERARSGTHALKATIETNDGAMHQAVIGRDLTLEAGRYGAWFYFSEALTTDYWVIMKLSNGRERDRFDIDVHAPDGQPRLRLFEHGQDYITEPARVPLPIGAWVHVEALYRSTAQSNGRLVVLQDGEPVLDSGARSTALDARVSFVVGSVSWWIDGDAPPSVYIDDASIEAAAVP